MSMKSKVGYGRKRDLSGAIESGKIDGGDIIITSDTQEMVFIDPENVPVFTKSRTQNEIEVNGVDGLGIPNNTKIPAGKSLDEIVKMLVQKTIPAVYTQPTAVIENNGGQAPGEVEAGTYITPKLRAVFNKGDAGSLTNFEILKNGISIISGTDPACNYSALPFMIGDETVSFVAKATYSGGDIKNDNLGEPSPNGYIESGIVRSAEYMITGHRNLFYGTGIGRVPELNSDVIRTLQNKHLNPTEGFRFRMVIPTGQQYVIIAYKDTIADLKQVYYVEGSDPNLGKNFVKREVQVADARGKGYGLIGYKAFTLQLSTPSKSTMTLDITI